MARYYSEDDIKEVLKTLIREPRYRHDGEDYYAGVSQVAGEILTLPTADVAPRAEVVAMMQWVELLKGQLAEAKSEVETLTVRLEMNEKAYDSLREPYHTDTDTLVEARRKTEVEVAREIFEEIERFLESQEAISENKRLKEVGDWIFHDYLPTQLAELKMKYTGERHETTR